MGPLIRFAQTGQQRLRIQTREDGVMLDQVVLSPSTYLTAAPGGFTNDMTIVAKPSMPYSGTPLALPGLIEAEHFDNGIEGAAYHDLSIGNTGKAYRQTDVDLESATENGYDVGWISAGEWLNYSVNIPTAGTYTLRVRVAAEGAGGRFHIESNGVDRTGAITVPNTGAWQTWTTITATISLPAGQQVLRLVVDAESAASILGNINWLEVGS